MILSLSSSYSRSFKQCAYVTSDGFDDSQLGYGEPIIQTYAEGDGDFFHIYRMEKEISVLDPSLCIHSLRYSLATPSLAASKVLYGSNSHCCFRMVASLFGQVGYFSMILTSDEPKLEHCDNIRGVGQGYHVLRPSLERQFRLRSPVCFL